MTDAEESKDPSRDFGIPAVIVGEFENAQRQELHRGLNAEWVIRDVDGESKVRVDLVTTRDAASVEDIWVVTTTAEGEETNSLHLHGDEAKRFIALIRNNAFEAPHPTSPGEAAAVVPIPEAIAAAYQRDPDALRAIIATDANARDVIALAHRRTVVEEFRRLLNDPDYFELRRTAHRSGSAERVWQKLFEANPWLLGLGLSTQLLVGWDPKRLEQVVAGFDVAAPGKRTDALMRTAGAVQLLAFVEIKRHDTPLLESASYRSGAYQPYHEISGAVAQAHTTIQLAMERIGTSLASKDGNGHDIPGRDSYLFRPRSYVVAGRLNEFVSPTGGVNRDKVRSFELYRRHLESPEIVTFDELLERAEALVAFAGIEATSEPDV